MRLLIDSQSLIWYVDQDHLLTPAAHAGITDPNNDLLLSAATVWEIAIKVGLKKLSLSMPYKQWSGCIVVVNERRKPTRKCLTSTSSLWLLVVIEKLEFSHDVYAVCQSLRASLRASSMSRTISGQYCLDVSRRMRAWSSSQGIL